jgi:putative protease
MATKPFNADLFTELESLSNRGYTSGFYQRHNSAETQNYQNNGANHCKQRYVGEIVSYDSGERLAEVLVKNKFAVGDTLELLSPQGNTTFVLDKIWDKYGGKIQVCPGSGYRVHIPLPTGDCQYALLARRI